MQQKKQNFPVAGEQPFQLVYYYLLAGIILFIIIFLFAGPTSV